MSALTYKQIGVLARHQANLPPHARLRIQALVKNALHSLCRRVSNRDDYKALQKTINVTCASGVISLSGDTTLLLHSVGKRSTLVINGALAMWAGSYERLKSAGLDKSVYWFARVGRDIHVRDITTGNLGAVNQTGTLTTNYVTTLLQLNADYDGELLDEIVKLLGSGVGYDKQATPPDIKIATQ